MKKKVKISRERIVFFNSLWVYFKQDGKVFRGRKGTRTSAQESVTRTLSVVVDSVADVKDFAANVKPELRLVLEREGFGLRG